MKHLTLKQIDQFISNLDSNSENMSNWQDHINKCDFCSKKIEETLAFNASLSKLIETDISSKQTEFIKKVTSVNEEVFIAYPIPPIIATPNKSFTVNYAANGPIHKKFSKFQYLGSLITKQKNILIRMIKDNTNKNTYLYLVLKMKKIVKIKLLL